MKPVVIQVFGDKTKKLEPEHHRIEFPGGHICVDRTTDGEYWAHIRINTDETNDYEIQSALRGQFVDSRVDYTHEEYMRRFHDMDEPIGQIENVEKAQHIAVRLGLET